MINGCLAERLRRETRNLLGNSRVGSNPAAVDDKFFATIFQGSFHYILLFYILLLHFIEHFVTDGEKLD
jgi:hypothetical protein